MQLTEGKNAPSFKGIDQYGNLITRDQFKGKKLLLYFYPKSNTPACTTQACNLRDHYEIMSEAGIAVVGVSPDEEQVQSKFSSKFNLPFHLIGDPGRRIIEKYGVWGEKQLYGRKYMGLIRTSFLIDEKGNIRKIFHRPKNKQHAEEVLAAANEL